VKNRAAAACAPLQSIVGLVLVKELLLVDEDAGVRIKELRIRELPFMRQVLTAGVCMKELRARELPFMRRVVAAWGVLPSSGRR
jgi:hypothetical protein